MIYIYEHLNKINGKVYIGQTVNPQQRWKPNRYKTSTYFYAAITKYGWENFEHRILAQTEKYDQADILEKYYISFFDSRNPQKGYNILQGGNSLGDYYSKEQNRKRQGELRKKYIEQHPKYKEVLLDQLVLANSKQNLEKKRKKAKENYKNGKSHLKAINEARKKRVECIETRQIFDSLTEAAKAYNINVSNLSAYIHGKKKSCGIKDDIRLHWRLL